MGIGLRSFYSDGAWSGVAKPGGSSPVAISKCTYSLYRDARPLEIKLVFGHTKGPREKKKYRRIVGGSKNGILLSLAQSAH
jgi:hypothetical protein